jgi:hypothetical protein
MRATEYHEKAPLVQWRSVFVGTVIGLGVAILLSALWSALAFATGVGFIDETFRWWIGGSVIFAMFLAAFFAGFLSGARGMLSGVFSGATVWGLLTIAVVAVGMPTVFETFTLDERFLAQTAAANLWPFFFSSLVGLGAATVGGAIGGAMPVAEKTVVVEEERKPLRQVPRKTGTEA